MDDPNAEEIRITLGRINRARMAQNFLSQAIMQLRNSGLRSWPEGNLNITDRIIDDLIRAENDLFSMIDYAERYRKTNVRTR